MKEAILKITSIEEGGFWGTTRVAVRVIERTATGEKEMGDYLVSRGSASVYALRRMRYVYEKNGWKLLGDWDF